jgi:hypothetical protein
MAVLTARTSRRDLALRLVWIGYALALAVLLAMPAQQQHDVSVRHAVSLRGEHEIR